ncbi:Alginate lyase [Ewingella americana]|uniref:Alginate lyase n=1 Tax=Ewingella americana TaxID=41202 RepID=A0A377NCS7_9GAMM|nr:Alginate lyase [Ewingella americana]
MAGIAWYLDKPDVLKKMVKLMKSKLDVQLMPDGTQPAELARTRSFHYSYFDLQAISLMAVLAQKEGI